MSGHRVSRVRVLARVRPAFGEEECVLATSVPDSTVTVNVAPRKPSLKARLPTAAKFAAEQQSYKFDHVLSQQATQGDLCSAVHIPEKVASCIDGNLCLCFAFGQTGSGKTHTILGPHALNATSCGSKRETWQASPEDGVLYSALHQGFLQAATPSGRRCQISVSVLEVYKERVMDLLHAKKEVQVKHSAQRGFYANGAQKLPCNNFQQGARILQKALQHRLTSAHQVNEHSSRSHAIMIVHFDTWAAEGTSEAGAAAQAEELFSVLVKAREAHEGASKASRVNSQQGDAIPAVDHNAAHDHQNTATESAATQEPASRPETCVSTLGRSSISPQKRRMRKYGQFILVDLAGSERVKATGTEDATGMSESCAINRSLFALGRVLNAVSETSQGRLQKVPYRDSVLTKLLANSLQHAAQITMIACLHPLATHIWQSTSTLQFAKVALSIKTKPVENVDPHDKMVMDLKQVVSRLRKENQSLTDAFLWLCSGNADWQTLVQTLPQNLGNQLPSTAPALLVGSKPDGDELCSGAFLESTKLSAAACSTPQTPELPNTPGQPQTPGLSDSRPCSKRGGSQWRQRRTRSRNFQHTSSSQTSGRRADFNPPHKECRLDRTGRQVLEQFPELAALESEFQDLVCCPSRKGSSKERCSVVEQDNRSSTPLSYLQQEMPPSDSRAHNDAPVGVDLTPNVLRNVLKEASESMNPDTAVERNDSEGDGNAAKGHAEEVESEAVLWAMHNLWFGVEEDMTAAAYKVHDELQSEGIAPSAEYYERITTEISKLFPLKWAQYSEKGATMNTMSKQQGIMNAPVTLEAGLMNRASWANLKRRKCSRAHLSTAQQHEGGMGQGFKCTEPPHRTAAVTQAHRSTAKTVDWGDVFKFPESQSKRPSRSSYSNSERTRSGQNRAFSLERFKTPGEQMRDRLAAKLGLNPMTPDPDTIRASWDCMGASLQGSQAHKTRPCSRGSDWATYHFAPPKTSLGHSVKARRPWTTSPSTVKDPLEEIIGARTLGRSEIADVDNLASQYLEQSSSRQRSLLEMVARNAAALDSL